MIPYGWGHSGAESGGDLKEAIVFDESAELARSRGGAGASRMSGSAHSSGAVTARSASAAVHVVRPASGSSDGGKGGDEKGDAMPMNAMKGKVARWQNLIPSFPWIEPGWRAGGRNPRKGRDKVLQRSIAEP